jgi:hypothetical protein
MKEAENTQSSSACFHIADSNPSVTGDSIVKEGNVYWSKRYNTPTDFSWYEASRVKVEGSVVTVTIAQKTKDTSYVDTTLIKRCTQ